MSRPVLIVAHPGHELRLFGWVERYKPLVCILTDGSGSTAEARTHFSRALIEGCGATVGPVMGHLADRAWYAAILAGDTAPFMAAASAIARAMPVGAMVVADPVEGYNPMHDLCAAVADLVAAAKSGTRMTYPLMRPAPGTTEWRLPPPVLARKAAALAAYTPLAEEAAALLQRNPAALDVESLRPDTEDWPERPRGPIDYEAIGASRSAAGTYAAVISYAGHVRPLVMRLRAAMQAASSAP